MEIEPRSYANAKVESVIPSNAAYVKNNILAVTVDNLWSLAPNITATTSCTINNTVEKNGIENKVNTFLFELTKMQIQKIQGHLPSSTYTYEQYVSARLFHLSFFEILNHDYHT